MLGLWVAEAVARDASEVAVSWDWAVVSTPDFYGPFRGTLPAFRPPVPKLALPSTLKLNREKRVSGRFEVIVGTDGLTTLEQTLTVSGPEAKRRIEEVLKRWRFEPATLDGEPIRVRIRITAY